MLEPPTERTGNAPQAGRRNPRPQPFWRRSASIFSILLGSQTTSYFDANRRRFRRLTRYLVGGVALLALVAPSDAPVTHWIVLVFFAISSAKMILSLALQVFRTRAHERQAHLERQAIGLPASIRERAFGSLLAAVIFAASSRFAELTILWGMLAAVFLAVGVFGLVYSSVVRAHPDKAPPLSEFTEQFLDQRVKVSRRAQPVSALILAAWFYAWRDLYGLAP